MSDVQISVETLLAIAIASQGGVIKVPADDFKIDLTGKAIAIDQMNDGRVVVLSLVDKEDVVYEDE